MDKLVLLEVDDIKCGDKALFVEDDIGDIVESISCKSSCESAVWFWVLPGDENDDEVNADVEFIIFELVNESASMLSFLIVCAVDSIWMDDERLELALSNCVLVVFNCEGCL